VRAVLNIHAGSIVIFEKTNSKIMIKPAKTLRDYKGVFKIRRKDVDFEEIRKKVKILRALKMRKERKAVQ
jgi:bifunctional DNA-binding transcriptional regulator/antitoxin component of YhaV-PrlF toxin-antitoxin module